MADKESILHLQVGERIIGMIKKSALTFIPRLFGSVLWLLFPFFFFFPLLQLGIFGVGIFIILSGSGVFFTVRIWIEMHYTMLIVTDRRIIDVVHTGIFKREIEEITKDGIVSVHVRKRSFWQKFFNLGTLVIRSKKINAFDFELTGVAKPQVARQFLAEALGVTVKSKKGTIAKS